MGTVTAVVLLIAAPTPAQADPRIDDLTLPDGPITATVDPSLLAASGPVTVSLQLSAPSLAEAVGADAKQDGADLTRAEQRDHVEGLVDAQQELADRVAELGAVEVAATQIADNSLVVEVDAARVPELAAQPGVDAVLPVVDFELDLSDTVPYIGASALHDDPGLTGAGTTVAVLDSGIDYTHARFGGAGTAAAYEAAYGTAVDDPRNTTTDGLFPTGKVIGGFDFVGEAWPGVADLAPDPDPIDCGPSAIAAPCAGGHGSHVASIIAGNNGVAPGASLYAYKVCSAVSTSCSGVALLQALEAALDPNGDGDVSDAVDVINMSLGANYGQIENPVSGASANAVRMGVVVVASAGNGADKPYITGSPSSTPEVISVAQTNVPSAAHFVLRVDEPAEVAGIYLNTNTVDWAPITTGFAGQIKYGTTPEERLGCIPSPYPAGFFDGMVALIDRGVCAVSEKVDSAADAGAIGVIIANNAAGAAPSFSFGGPDTFDPQQTLIVGLEVGNALRTGLATGNPVVVAVDPADATPLAGSMAVTSSRGPNVSDVAIKPDIGAPGASVSAEAGTGTGETAFGGTSGAAPMVSGSVALLLQAYPDRSPLELKSVLMNTAETEIFIQPATQPGELAEITRIGGGEVRVDDAHASRTAAWSAEDLSAGLSFGYQAVSHFQFLTKSITVHNYSNQRRTYTVQTSFRHDDDAASGAVRFTVPSRVTVRAGRSATVPVVMRIDPAKLPDWVLDGGPNGANGSLLRANEFDGYVTLSGGGDEVHLPWHVLPHNVSNVTAPSSVRLRGGEATASMFNLATDQAGVADVFAHTGSSPRIPSGELPGEGDGFAVVDLKSVGVRAADGVLQFGINTFGERSHPAAPAEFDVLIDVDRDGTPEWLVLNRDLTQLTTGAFDGRNVVFVNQIGTNTVSAFFFTETHLNSANVILTVPLEAVGLAEGSQFDFDVLGVDWYFTGNVTDSIEDMTFTVGTPKYTSADTVEVPAFRAGSLEITAVDGGAEASPSQTGMLLLWRDGEQGREATTIQVR
jgi:subtilisin family serine protease